MKVYGRILSAATLILLAAGCAHRVYTIGAENPERGTELRDGSRVEIRKLPGSAAFEHDAEIERKMAVMLKHKGYEPVDAGAGEYVLLYDYRITARTAYMRLELLSGAKEGIRTVRRGGPYTHVLELQVVDAESYDNGERGAALIWQGGAMIDAPTRSPKFHDMVVLAAFDHLGEENVEGSVDRIGFYSARARGLRD